MNFEDIKKFFKDQLTENDNMTYCAARVSGFLGVICFLCLGVAHFIVNHTIDFMAYGSGFGGLMAGAGVYLGAKQFTESK
jgi:hypothetical protein